MCGIAASINFPLHTQKINKVMGHRGPDERNEYKYNNVHFYHLRLSILDIGGGVQPMHLSDRFSIIFNGEIYNHEEVRRKYALNCKTSSDTETILHIYDKIGAKMLNEFDGMFALVILDKVKNTLFIARDRAGKKPIYYYKDHEKFVLASELNALKTLLPLEIDNTGIEQYIFLGNCFKSQTCYKNVEELISGSYMTVNLNDLSLKVEKWWSIENYYSQPSSDDFETALQKVDDFLHLGIKRRIESSDLEVGTFLSGGIDSGLVTAIGSQYNQNIKSFTVAFSGAYNEAPLAKLVADKYKTNHTEINISLDNLNNDIEKILINYGEPFADSSAIPSYYVSQEAKKHLTVILNGDGGDEMFGGYRRYVPFAKFDFFNNNEVVRQMAAMMMKVLPISNDKQNKYNYLYRLANLASKKGVNTYMSTTSDIFEGYEKHLLFNSNALHSFEKFIQEVSKSKLTGLQKLMYIDFENILSGDLLVKMDIASMSASLEGRSPFLSKEILEYAPSINDKFKVNGTSTKDILRQLSKKYLPEELINQPKRGFEIPLKKWINEDLNAIINDYLGNSDAYVNNFVDKKFIDNILNSKNVNIPQEKKVKMIWVLFCLEVWYQKIGKNA
jgi:asparagine synthase (glutamine-hydrolysing)